MSDEFFIDDDVIISIDDNMIEEVIPQVSVIERKVKDDSILRLNSDQINAALINLIADKYKNSSILKQKVRNYASLFLQFPQTKSIKLESIKSLRPVILANKLTYFASDDEYNQNKEYEQAHFEKSEKQGHFLAKFQSLNTSNKESYPKIANKLYALYVPFAQTSSGTQDGQLMTHHVEHEVDAYTQCAFSQEAPEDGDEAACKNMTYRLISKVSNGKNVLYDGDDVNVIGFYNVTAPSNTVHQVDMAQYIKQLSSLVEGDRVFVCFNDAMFDATKKHLVKEVKATVLSVSPTKLTIALSKPAAVNELTYDLTTPLSSPFYVYPQNASDTSFRFRKSLLTSESILFKIPPHSTMEETSKFIIPSSISELIMMYEATFKSIHNLYDLANVILTPNGVSLDDLSVDLHDLITYVFSADKAPLSQSAAVKPRENLPYRNTTPLVDFKKHAAFLTAYDKDYQSYDNYIDDALNRFRYLKSQQDSGAYYTLNIVKANLKHKYKKHVTKLSQFHRELLAVERSLDNLELKREGASGTSANGSGNGSCDANFAKEYKKADKLADDNGKTLYFDKKFDTTLYDAKAGYNGSGNGSKGTKGLHLHVMNELLSIPKYKAMSKKDLDFEIESIVSGKRQVRIGDVCVLTTSYGDTVYVRQIVEGKEMWVKKFRTPFKVCTDSPLVHYNDLVKVDACIKQTFDQVCRTNGNAQVHYKYRLLESIKVELTSIIALLENFNDYIEVIDKDIESSKSLATIKPSEHGSKHQLEYIEHHNYDEYIGEEGEVGDVQYTIDYNDQSNFSVNFAPSASSTTPADSAMEAMDNMDILKMFLGFIQIPLEAREMAYILSYINTKFPKQIIAAQLQYYENGLMAQVNKQGYKTNEEYKKKIDAQIKQKVQKKENELVAKYFFNVFRHIIAFIIILMFIRYPALMMKNVLQSCVKVLAYIGYPVTHNKNGTLEQGQKSLTAYFACLLTSISVQDDVRFALFYEKNASEIQATLHDTIDEILSNNYELKAQLALAKPPSSSSSGTSEASSSGTGTDGFGELEGFKPHSKFGNIDRMSKQNKVVLRFLKTIQDNIARSKITKINTFNIPSVFNSCCAERLEKDLNFFNFFEESNEYKTARTALHTSMQKDKFVDENLHPRLKLKTTTDIFASMKINQDASSVKPISDQQQEASKARASHIERVQKFVEDNSTVIGVDTPASKLFSQMLEHYSSDDWWYDSFYPTLNEEFDSLVAVLNKVGDGVDKEAVQYVKDIIVNVNTGNDVSSVRQTLYTFVSTRIKQFLGKIINKQKVNNAEMNEETLRNDPLFAIMASAASNKNFDIVLQNLRATTLSMKNVELLNFEATSEEMVIQNISVLAFFTLQVLSNILQTANASHQALVPVPVFTLAINPDIRTKERLQFAASIVNYAFKSLSTVLKNSLVDRQFLNSEVEKLREQRKQEVMSVYSADDEERALQQILKKIGVKNWADKQDDDLKSEEQVAAENPQVNVYKDEYEQEKDYVYSAYKGDNDDADEVDEDFISMEAYDN